MVIRIWEQDSAFFIKNKALLPLAPLTRTDSPQRLLSQVAEEIEEDLMISPLDANCADFFRYTEDGQILPIEYPSKKSAADTTINRLALNIDKLKNLRSIAVQGALEGFDDFSDEEKLLLIQGFEQRNSDDEYEEFCAAIVYVLK